MSLAATIVSCVIVSNIDQKWEGDMFKVFEVLFAIILFSIFLFVEIAHAAFESFFKE